MISTREVLSEKELAKVLDLSVWTIRTLRRKEGLPHFRAGKKFLYRLPIVLEWMDKQSSI